MILPAIVAFGRSTPLLLALLGERSTHRFWRADCRRFSRRRVSFLVFAHHVLESSGVRCVVQAGVSALNVALDLILRQALLESIVTLVGVG